MHSTVLVIGVNDDAHLDALLERFCNGDLDEYKEFHEAAQDKETLRKEYEETVFSDEYYEKYDKEKFGKKSTEVFATLEEYLEYTYSYVRDPEDPVNGEFGEYFNPDLRMDWYSVGGRWSGALLGSTSPTQAHELMTCAHCHGERMDPDFPTQVCRWCSGSGQQTNYFEPENNPADRPTVAEILKSGIRESRRAAAERTWDFWEAECAEFYPGLSLSSIDEEQCKELSRHVNVKYCLARGYIEEKIGVWGALEFERGKFLSKEEFATFNFNYFPTDDYVQQVGDHEEWFESENVWEVLESLPIETRVYLVDYHN
jgi:hypothetical protein